MPTFTQKMTRRGPRPTTANLNEMHRNKTSMTNQNHLKCWKLNRFFICLCEENRKKFVHQRKKMVRFAGSFQVVIKQPIEKKAFFHFQLIEQQESFQFPPHVLSLDSFILVLRTPFSYSSLQTCCEMFAKMELNRIFSFCFAKITHKKKASSIPCGTKREERDIKFTKKTYCEGKENNEETHSILFLLFFSHSPSFFLSLSLFMQQPSINFRRTFLPDKIVIFLDFFAICFEGFSDFCRFSHAERVRRMTFQLKSNYSISFIHLSMS